MADEQFHSDIDKMFEYYLKETPKPLLRVCKDGKVITKMNYDKVVFDAEMNIYKILPNGTIERVRDPEFTAVAISR